MKNNFFRTDLNLKGRWWHRLLLIVFIICFVVLLGISISSSVDDAQLPKYSNVGMLSERMDDKIRLIGDLVKPDEKVAVYEHNLYGTYNGKSFYSGNGDWLLEQEYYCAKNISDKVEEISAKTGVNYYKGNLNLVQLNEFKKYLSQNKAQCVQVLELDSFERYGNVKKALSWGLEADDMAVWKVSIIKTVLSVLQQIFFIVLGFLVVMVIYYKIILYIIFGSKKIDNNKDSKKL
ncbi:hypothetical protein KJZ71_04920 [Patescibacteria group bacterium]|nr:hypothetical protein [Patescibacteria group bacterium]MDL1953476.1 hypothetical protein [Candidatus Uhrbacteria bacterium UHB]